MYAIKNKKTGNLLRIYPEKDYYWDRGMEDCEKVYYAYLTITDSIFGPIYVNDIKEVEELLKNKTNVYDDRIIFDKFTAKDLEIIELQQK